MAGALEMLETWDGTTSPGIAITLVIPCALSVARGKLRLEFLGWCLIEWRLTLAIASKITPRKPACAC